MELDKNLQEIKDRRHAAFSHKYHLIDMLRMSRFTFADNMAQKWENYKYTFNRRSFLLQNGLYIAIVLIFIALCIITPVIKGTPLLTYNNVLNILQQASPRMFLALGVAGLILLAGTDLSIGRMVGMGMTTATIIMHQGINTGGVFGHIFDFTGWPIPARMIFALIMCIILCTCFTSLAGFFTAKFKMHPFISTMANMLMIFGLITYATKGVSFGAIEPSIPTMIIPRVNGFPTIILWAVAAVAVVWFIWNKTTFGKNLYAVGGNSEAAAVSGISVFAVTIGAFILAGILYGFGSWLECARMVGSGSAAYGQGWETDAIAACVVGGVSFTGGIGKISGVVVGVLIFNGPDLLPDHSWYRYEPAVRILRYHHSGSGNSGLPEVRSEEISFTEKGSTFAHAGGVDPFALPEVICYNRERKKMRHHRWRKTWIFTRYFW